MDYSTHLSSFKDIKNDLKNQLQKLKLKGAAAGKHATLKIPLAFTKETIAEVKLRFLNSHYETINYVYVLTKSKKLAGVFSIRDLFKISGETLIKDIMTKKPSASLAHVDQERVAHLALKHNIKAIPLIDKHNNFLGVVTSDRILHILNKEFQEDFLLRAGILPHVSYKSCLETSLLRSFAHRMPWIIIGLFGGIVAAKIVSGFQNTLSTNLVLASFMPLVVYISNAVGNQTQTLLIRDVAFNPKLPLLKYIVKQSLIVTLIALCSSLTVYLITSLFWKNTFLALIIALAMLIAISVANLIAILIPLILRVCKQDPANGSGPFANILEDIMSILIYFTTATLLLGL
jgi:magnesium transporter